MPKMQSPWIKMLRWSVLVGCLGFLPLAAAGGLAAPGRIIARAQKWLAEVERDVPTPHIIQMELPADALRYRAVGVPIDASWEEPNEMDLAEVRPVSFEEIIPPENRETSSVSIPQPWPAAEDSTNRSQVISGDGVFERGHRAEQASHAWSQAANTIDSIKNHLQALGATEVRLEPWGNTGQLFRCCAVLPIAGADEVQRHFQSIGANADEVAQEVLAQVSAWKRQ
jgi:hypothetical protein